MEDKKIKADTMILTQVENIGKGQCYFATSHQCSDVYWSRQES